MPRTRRSVAATILITIACAFGAASQAHARDHIFGKSVLSEYSLAHALHLPLVAFLQGPVSGPVTYVYDELGRLVGAIDAAGNAAVYNYDAVGNILSIQRFSSTQVSVTSFNPTGGPAGTAVTIYGTGFSSSVGQNSVQFNGVGATIIAATPNQLVATVPSGATTGPISVTSPLGSAISTNVFHVGPAAGAPVINSFTPGIGNAGATVTIYGTNFDPSPGNNHLRFNDVANAVVTASTSTTITATVPSLAGSGKMKLATPTGNTISGNDFFIPFVPFTSGAIGQTGRTSIGTSLIATLGTGQIAIFTFDATRGQRISLQLSNSSFSGGTAYILRPDGSVLRSTSFTTSDLTFPLPAPLPVSGTYALGDPLRLKGSGPNLYAYTHDSPTNLTDPSGQASLSFGGRPVNNQREYDQLQYIAGRKNQIRVCMAHEIVCDDSLHWTGQYVGLIDESGPIVMMGGGVFVSSLEGLVGESAVAGLGEGTIFTHFTDAQGLTGITGLDGVAVGDTAVVNELNFGMGQNTFLANNAGDIFISDVAADASSGTLDGVGVFGGKQAFAIQMSQETLLDNGIRVVMSRPGIYTIPGGTTLKGVFIVIGR
jgi:YD repeat-containing protein